MAKRYENYVKFSKEHEDWINSKWRPMMGWLYMATCAFDFLIAPVVWPIFQAMLKVNEILPWEPLTLQGAGLYHLAMGAVLGIAAWSRGQERIRSMNLYAQTYRDDVYEETSITSRRRGGRYRNDDEEYIRERRARADNTMPLEDADKSIHNRVDPEART